MVLMFKYIFKIKPVGGKIKLKYYIDPINGNDNNSGTCIGAPLKSYEEIAAKPGDEILFKRGSFIRGKIKSAEGEPGKPITYGAYGEGRKPVFCGSLDLSESDMWECCGNNIWCCRKINDEAGNFIFDNSDECGALRWSLDDLSGQGDFYDECFGFREARKNIPENHAIYMYSEKNPGEYYKHIECVVFGARNLADNGHDITFENLSL